MNQFVYYVAKLLISAALILLVSEASKRSSFLGGLLASLPLVSFFAFFWLYWETKDSLKVADLSRSIFWLVLPSLLFFIALPVFLKRVGFYSSMAMSTAIMFAGYLIMAAVLKKFGLPF